MTTPMATSWMEIGDLTGPEGPTGVSVTDAEINTSGDLIVTLTNSSGQSNQVNAGQARGAPGGGIDFESSVATVADLPTGSPYGEARYVRDDGHLYVYEAAADRAEAVDGWTDVGAIKGDVGATGPGGADGVSVIGAAIDGNGHLILSLSNGSNPDVGVARGAAGTPGTDGADGADGEPGTTVLAYPAGSVPDATQYRVGTVAIGGDGKLLRAN